jgi:hypothetical protein
MRQLANAISLFVRRMDDLGLKQDAMSTICFEHAYNRLDQETALRYATYCQLGKSQGVVESMESLTDFLRSEATTLDRLGLSSCLPVNTVKSPRAHLNVLQQELKGIEQVFQLNSLLRNVFRDVRLRIDSLTVQYTCKNQLKISDNLLVKIKGASYV